MLRLAREGTHNKPVSKDRPMSHETIGQYERKYCEKYENLYEKR
jgi:hypothetical protein